MNKFALTVAGPTPMLVARFQHAIGEATALAERPAQA